MFDLMDRQLGRREGGKGQPPATATGPRETTAVAKPPQASANG